MSKRPLILICVCYLVASAIFGSVNLEGDERKFVIEPYQLLGGDYTKGHLAEGEIGSAARCAVRSYFFYWYYRPMFAPIIEERHRDFFAAEEERFGYVRAESAVDRSEVTLERYQQWMIVPEPDRWYHHGAGKPLLPAVLTIPSLGLVQLLTRGGPTLLEHQFAHNYHPIFIVVRLSHIIAGLVSILLVYRALREEHDQRRAALGTAIFALFPLSIQWFPNLHHDAIMVPFVVAATTDFLKARYIRSGVYYGLALASKNAALLLFPALLFILIGRLLRLSRTAEPHEFRARAQLAVRGMLLVVLFAVIALLPFANPVSYAKEVLTPFTEREYDARGEDVSTFSLSARLQDPLPEDEFQSVRRREIMLLARMSMTSTALLFMILAVLLAAPATKGDLARLSLFVLLLVIPYQIVFGEWLNYRYLLFLPFFVFLVSSLVETRYLKWLLLLVVVVDLIMLIDPMTVVTHHHPVGPETFWQALLG